MFSVAAKALAKSFICQLPLPTKGSSALLDLTNSRFLVRTTPDPYFTNLISELISNCMRNKIGIKEAYPKSIRGDSNKSFSDYKKFLVKGDHCASRILNDKFKLATYYDTLVRRKPMPMSWSKAHIFFLHYQPEATSCPLGGSFYDQRTAIQQVYSQLDVNEILLVREHPIQLFFCGIEQTWDKLLDNIFSEL